MPRSLNSLPDERVQAIMRAAVSIVALTCALMMSLPSTASATPNTPELSAVRLIKRTEATLRALITPQRTALATEKAIAAAVHQVFDMGEFARWCLHRHWTSMAPPQRAEIATLLGTIVERRYAALIRAALGQPITYLAAKKRGNDVIVRTETITKKRGRTATARVDYVVSQRPGGLRVVDLITDTISLRFNYRALFNRIIAKRGVAGLIGKLRKKAK